MAVATGECLCGRISVSMSKEMLDTSDMVTVCHCKNCCRASGSLGAISIILPESAVKITGEPKIYQDSDTDSGTPVQRAFCDHCGSPIYTATSRAPGIRVVRLGLFDTIPKPAMEGYCKSMPAWAKTIDGVKHFDTLPSK